MQRPRFGVLLLVAVCSSSLPMRAQPAPPAPRVIGKQDLIYGRVEGSALLADVAYPDGAGPFPALVYVHGGGWRGGTRADASRANGAKWAESGYFTMTVEYRLAGGSPAPAPYLDVLTAIRWLHAHAAEDRVEPDRIYLIGFSSGGHLVTLAATLGDGPFKRVGGWENARSDVRAVISTGGACDLNTLSRDRGHLGATEEVLREVRTFMAEVEKGR